MRQASVQWGTVDKHAGVHEQDIHPTARVQVGQRPRHWVDTQNTRTHGLAMLDRDNSNSKGRYSDDNGSSGHNDGGTEAGNGYNNYEEGWAL